MDNHEKENALNIVTDERTYQVFAESPEDARCGGDFCRRQQQVAVCVWVDSRILTSNCVSVQRVV